MIIWMLSLLLSTSFAFAETGSPEFTDAWAAYHADMDRYKLAQGQHSAHLIAFVDQDGAALQRILNPNRYESMLIFSQSSADYTQKMSQLSQSQLNLIYAMYTEAFIRKWGSYDQEYLNILDMKFRAFKWSWRQLSPQLNRKKMTASDIARVQLLFNQADAIIAELDKNIQKRRFAAAYKGQAMARLAMFKGMVQATKPKI